MQPADPPLSSHTDLELTRLAEEAGYIYHDGWFMERRMLADYDLLKGHPRPPRPYPYGRQLRADASSFAGLGWLFSVAVLVWGALMREWTTLGFGGLCLVMMVTFLYRTTRAIRQGRLLLGKTQRVIQRASLITSTLDRLEITVHPAEPWSTVEIQLPPVPSRYLLERNKHYEVLLLALQRPEDTQLVGFRPRSGDDVEASSSDPS